jgi:hypothetical protein
VTVCGPTRKELAGARHEVDFDDPALAASEDWKGSHRTKLRIQVTFNYRLPIPFANWLIHAAALNREIPSVLRLGREGRDPDRRPAYERKYHDAARRGVYVLPIRAAYTLRMQSNIYVNEARLPEANTCRTTNRLN